MKDEKSLDLRTKVFAWLGPFGVAVGAWSATAQMLDYTNGKWQVIISAGCLMLSIYCAREVHRFLRRQKADDKKRAFAASDWTGLVSLSVTCLGSAAICVILALATVFPRSPTQINPDISSSTSSDKLNPMINSPIDGFKTNDTTVPVQVTVPAPAPDHKWMLAVQSSRRQDSHCWFYQLTIDGPASYSGRPGVGPSNPDKARGTFTVHLVDVDPASEQAIMRQAQTNGSYYIDNGMPCPSGVRFYHQVKVERP